MSLELFFPTSSTSPSPEPFTYTGHNGIELRLVGRQSLWAHVLFNASRYCADLIKDRLVSVKDKTVLELGSGSGLAAIECVLSGAKWVACNDYPKKEIEENIVYNVNRNLANWDGELEVRCYKWADRQVEFSQPFDTVLLNDCVQILAAHNDIMQEICARLAIGGELLVVFEHHETNKIEQTLEFVNGLEGEGFVRLQYFKHRYGPMFPEDNSFEGHVEERSWVHAQLFRRVR